MCYFHQTPCTTVRYWHTPLDSFDRIKLHLQHCQLHLFFLCRPRSSFCKFLKNIDSVHERFKFQSNETASIHTSKNTSYREWRHHKCVDATRTQCLNVQSHRAMIRCVFEEKSCCQE